MGSKTGLKTGTYWEAENKSHVKGEVRGITEFVRACVMEISHVHIMFRPTDREWQLYFAYKANN